MRSRDSRDLVAGGVLIALGAFAAIHATINLNLGTVRHMGPGMFPMALGVLLAALGVLVLLPALFRSGSLPRPDVRPLLAVSASVLAFAFTIRTLGLAPAVACTALVAVLADNKLGPIGAVILAAALALVAVLIFVYGLGMPLQIVNWPF
jgi:hypothetical protein